jgi:LacI family transcriptional regulator
VSPSITQKDIAQRLGVSVTLVSRVLGGKAAQIGAARATVESIRQAAAELGYVPNANARILKGAPTRTLGVVVYDFEDPFLGAIIGALQRLAHAHEHSLVLAGFEQRRVQAQSLMPLTKHGISGLIIVGAGSRDAWLDGFLSRGLPVARIGESPDATHARVAVDGEGGVRLLLNHLRRRGIRRAGFLSDPHPAHLDRLRSFERLAAEFGIETRPSWQVTRAESGTEAGLLGARQIVRESGTRAHTEALVAASDAIAIGALRALSDAGISVPAKMAVTGFDDLPFGDALSPSLTTVRQPVQEMARTAFAWVSTDAAAAGTSSAPRVLLPGELVIRESA